MKKFEKIFGILFVIAIIFKFALWPGGALIATFSLTSLACIYLFYGFAFFNNIKLKNIFDRKSYKGISALRIIGSIGAGIGLQATCFGILFKLMHWSGGGVMSWLGLSIIFIVTTIVLIKYLRSNSNFYIMIGTGIGLVLFCAWILSMVLDLPIYRYFLFRAGVFIILVTIFIALINYSRSKTDFYKAILLRIIVIGGLGFLLTIESCDIAITKVLYRNHPDLVKAYERYLNNPGNDETHKQWRIEYERAITPQKESVDE